jgi:hypothetical protein
MLYWIRMNNRSSIQECHSVWFKAWKWLRFVFWLPWFILTWPWQIQKAYSQVFRAISLSEGLDFEDIESNQYTMVNRVYHISNRSIKSRVHIGLKAR